MASGKLPSTEIRHEERNDEKRKRKFFFLALPEEKSQADAHCRRTGRRLNDYLDFPNGAPVVGKNTTILFARRSALLDAHHFLHVKSGGVARHKRRLRALNDHRLIRSASATLLLVHVQKRNVRIQGHLLLQRGGEPHAGVVDEDALVHALHQPIEGLVIALDVHAPGRQPLATAVVLHDALGIVDLAAEHSADPGELSRRDVEGQLADECADGLRREVVRRDGGEGFLGFILRDGVRNEADEAVQARVYCLSRERRQRGIAVVERAEREERAALALVGRVAVVARVHRGHGQHLFD